MQANGLELLRPERAQSALFQDGPAVFFASSKQMSELKNLHDRDVVPDVTDALPETARTRNMASTRALYFRHAVALKLADYFILIDAVPAIILWSLAAACLKD